MPAIEIGRLLRAGTTGFIAGCRVSQLDAPAFGALVRAPWERVTRSMVSSTTSTSMMTVSSASSSPPGTSAMRS